MVKTVRVTYKSLHCDNEGCNNQVRCDTDSVIELRKAAKKDGWSRENGRDICWKCNGHG